MISTQAELQAALDVGGTVVCDPTTVIDLSSAVTVTVPDTRLIGANLSTVAVGGHAVDVSVSDVELKAVTVVGPSGAAVDASQRLINAVGTQTAPLFRVNVRDCHFTGSQSDSVWLEWCVDSTVTNTAIYDFLNSGVMVISGNRVNVSGNSIVNGQIGIGGVEVYGIAFTDLLNTSSARSLHCTAIGNRLHQIDWEAIDTHGGNDIVVSGNTITASRRGVALVTGNATRVTGPVNCVVSGNLVDATGVRTTAEAGVFLGGISGQPASGTVTGNQIVGYDGASSNPFVTSFWDRANTVIGGNSRPHVLWTAVPLTGGWTPNASFPPQYMVDGNQVFFRGGAIPPAGGIAGNPLIGTLGNAAAWPQARTFYGLTKGSNAAAGIGVLNLDVDGKLRVDYGSTSDTFTYWLTGTCAAI